MTFFWGERWVSSGLVMVVAGGPLIVVRVAFGKGKDDLIVPVWEGLWCEQNSPRGPPGEQAEWGSPPNGIRKYKDGTREMWGDPQLAWSLDCVHSGPFHTLHPCPSCSSHLCYSDSPSRPFPLQTQARTASSAQQGNMQHRTIWKHVWEKSLLFMTWHIS